MNPENITTSQIVGNFTAKHWATVIAAIFSGIGALIYAGYWAGQRVAEAQALVQQADLKALNASISTKLEIMQAQAQKELATASQMKEMLERAQRTTQEKATEIEKLTLALGQSNNCSFIHRQIVDTKRDIESTGSVLLLEAGKEWQEKQKARQIALEQRLNSYQQQLGTCNK